MGKMRSPTFGILTVLHLEWWLTVLIVVTSIFSSVLLSLVIYDVIHYRIAYLLLCYVVSSPRPCTGASPLNPTGGLPSPDPLFCGVQKILTLYYASLCVGMRQWTGTRCAGWRPIYPSIRAVATRTCRWMSQMDIRPPISSVIKPLDCTLGLQPAL